MSTHPHRITDRYAARLDPLPLTRFGEAAIRYAVVLVLGWIGMMKFSTYEAAAIEGLVASSPFLAWLYSVGSLQAASNLIGVIEVSTAICLGLGPWYRTAGLIGAAAATITFVLTLSMLFSAPGWEPSLGGFPALSVVPGQFLLKDAVLLAASIWLLGRAAEQARW